MLNDPILLIPIRVIIFKYGNYQSSLKSFFFLKESSVFNFENSEGEKRDGSDSKAAYPNPIDYFNIFIPLAHKYNRTKQTILITSHNYMKKNKKPLKWLVVFKTTNTSF